MAKAAYFVKAILQELIVQESEQQIEAAESADAMNAMNDWMFMQDAKGVSVGYTVISDLGDTVTIPPGANTGLIKNVAVYMAPQYGATVSQATALLAEQGLEAMRNLSPGQQPMSHPCTLPLGQGNRWPGYNGSRTTQFYPCPEDQVLNELDGSILLETDTTND